MEDTLNEGCLAEVQVELTGKVELRMLKTPHVVHILTSRGRQRCEGMSVRVMSCHFEAFTLGWTKQIIWVIVITCLTIYGHKNNYSINQ